MRARAEHRVLAANVTSLHTQWRPLAALGWGLLCAVEARCRWSDDSVREARAASLGGVVVSAADAGGEHLVAMIERVGRLAARPPPIVVDPRFALWYRPDGQAL